MIKRLLKGIFVCFMLVFVMSHNTYATTTNIVPQSVYVHRVSRSDMSTNSYETYTFQYTNTTYGYKWAGIGKAWSIMSMKFPLGQTVEANSYFSMSFTCLNCSFGNVTGLGATKIDSVSFVQGTTNGGSIFLTGHFTSNVTQLSIGDDNNVGNVFLYGVVNQDFNIMQPKINIFDYQDQASEQIIKWREEEENTTNSNMQQGQNNADSSTSDSEEATSSLLSVIGSFVGAITTASPSNCSINGNMGNFSMGNIDLCANPVPTFVQIISSLVLIAICVPFAIIMFNRFISLFRSFQG